jgi:hypothetical protein
MIYECQQGHICFSNEDDLNTCAMKGCNKSTIVLLISNGFIKLVS